MVALPVQNDALHVVERAPVVQLAIVPRVDYTAIQDRLEAYLRSLPPMSEWMQLALFDLSLYEVSPQRARRAINQAASWVSRAVQLILFAPDAFLSKHSETIERSRERTIRRHTQKYRDLLKALMPLSDQERVIAQRLSLLCLGDALKCKREYLVCCQSEKGTTFYLLYRDCQLVAKIYMRSDLYTYRRYVFALAARALLARGWRPANVDTKCGYGGAYTLTHAKRNVTNLVRVA